MLAASNGHIDLVKIFLDVNARVDVFDQEARLEIAITFSWTNSNLSDNIFQKYQKYESKKLEQTRSALHLAAESGNADICEMLLSKNAYVNRYEGHCNVV